MIDLYTHTTLALFPVLLWTDQAPKFPMPLNKKAILSKTELGRNAIAQRLPELPPRLRPLLIMVDGKRTLAELEKIAEAVGGMASIDVLVDLGMVEADAGSAPPSGVAEAPAVVAPSAAPAGGPVLSLAEAREQLADYFEAQLGPSAQMLAIQLRACDQVRYLKPLIDRGLDNLQHFKGLAAVKAYEADLGSRVPKA